MTYNTTLTACWWPAWALRGMVQNNITLTEDLSVSYENPRQPGRTDTAIHESEDWQGIDFLDKEYMISRESSDADLGPAGQFTLLFRVWTKQLIYMYVYTCMMYIYL